MANKKFSDFDLKTSSSDVAFVVGFNGTDNVRIAPSNLSSGGASSLNGLTDCLVDTDSLYVGEVPAGLSGNPQGNTILGIDSGSGLTSGFDNTFIGRDAAKIITDSDRMVVIGSGAASSSSSNGDNCVVIGYQAHGSSIGSNNVAIGYQASALSGVGNGTVIGYRAGRANTGASSVFVGYQAAQSNQAAGHVSIGYQAGFSQTSGTKNTNLGYQAGYSNTSQASRTCIGYEAGKSNTGTSNTFIGQAAGKGSSTGQMNVVIGSNAMAFAALGNFNIGVGHQVAQESTAANNTIVGYQAGQYNTTGGNNTMVGYEAGRNTNTGANNVFIGAEAGDQMETGGNSTMIGYNAQASSTSVSNEITLGDTNIAALRCAVTSITSLSDERDKSEIKDITYGLDFIDGLQPREFVWDNRPETDGDGEEFYSANKGKKDFGFIAQEVQALDNDTLRLVYDENPDKLELSYGKLVPVLVQAIKELKAEIELLKS